MPREVNRPSDRDDPRDCNPMFNRLPAEVTSRRTRVVVTEDTGEGPVTLDRKVVFLLKPDKRQKWLVRALKQLGDGQVRPNDLYDVIASTRFADDVPYKVGVKMSRAVAEKLSLFTGKQQQFLCSQAGLHVKFGQKVSAKDPEDSAKADAPVNGKQAAASMEEMMARCQAFARTKAREREGDLAEAGDAGGAKADEVEVEYASDGAVLDPKAMEAMAKSIQADREAKRAKSKRGRSKENNSEKTKKAAKSSSSSSSSKAKRGKKEKARAKSSSSSSSSSKAKRRKKEKVRAKSSSSSSSSKAKRRKKEKARATSKSPTSATGPPGKQKKDDKSRRQSKSSDSSKSARKKASKSEPKKKQKKDRSSSSSKSSESPSKSRAKAKEKEKEKDKDRSKDKEKSSKEKKTK